MSGVVAEWIGHSAFSAVVAGSNPSDSGWVLQSYLKQFSADFWSCRGGFLRVLPFPPPTKKLQRSNSKLVTSYGGLLLAHLLSLHNWAGVAGSRSALTSHRLKYKALVQIRHLFIIYLCYNKTIIYAIAKE